MVKTKSYLVAALLAGASFIPLHAARAATIDLLDLQPSYNIGAGYVNGVEPTWSETATANTLTISKGVTANPGKGPHNFSTTLATGNFTAKVSLSVTNTFTTGEFDVDLPGLGWSGFTVGERGNGTEYVGIQSRIPGNSYSSSLYSVSTGPLDLELTRTGDVLSELYSTNGINYTTLYTVAASGVLGPAAFDLNSWESTGSTHAGSVEFSNLTVSAVPLPPALPLFATAILGIVGLAGRKRASIV